MLKGLSDKLRSSLERLTKLGVVDKEVVEDLIREIQRSLLSSDVDVDLVFELSESIRSRSFEKLPGGINRKEHVIKVVYEELTKILGADPAEVKLQPKKVLMVGLFGSGKTSTSAKLARFYKKKGLKPFLICCDTFRPAAYEQLQQLAQKIDVPFYGEKGEKDARKVLTHALLKLQGDVIIVDSSGRNALDKELSEEIKSLSSLLNPDEKILVIPADIGQAAKKQASAFHDNVGITDVIITKLDATARGGGALAACSVTKAKVKFITSGETPDDMEHYDPKKFVARLIGFSDLETLLEKAKEAVDEKKAEKIMKGDFSLDDFYSQLESITKMGSLSQILDMAGLGKLGTKVPGGLDVQESKIKKWRHVINSMTVQEKNSPDIINPSRIKRIATGSGSQEADVRDLITNYNKSKKMMKRINPGKLKRGGMSSLLKQMGMR